MARMAAGSRFVRNLPQGSSWSSMEETFERARIDCEK